VKYSVILYDELKKVLVPITVIVTVAPIEGAVAVAVVHPFFASVDRLPCFHRHRRVVPREAVAKRVELHVSRLDVLARIEAV